MVLALNVYLAGDTRKESERHRRQRQRLCHVCYGFGLNVYLAGDTRKESRRQHLKSHEFGQPRFHQGE